MSRYLERSDVGTIEPPTWKKDALALYAPHASAIAGLMSENQFCIVPGRFGVGKSHFLTPALNAEFSKRAVDSHWTDSSQLRESAWRKHEYKKFNGRDRKVLIVDEAGEVPSHHRDRTVELAEDFYNHQVSMVGLLAYGPKYPELRDRYTDAWKEAVNKVTGKELSVYPLPDTILTPDVAESFLNSRNTMTDPAMEYVINNLPMNWKIISNIIAYTLDDVIMQLKKNLYSWLNDGLLSSEEYTTLKDKLYK